MKKVRYRIDIDSIGCCSMCSFYILTILDENNQIVLEMDEDDIEEFKEIANAEYGFNLSGVDKWEWEGLEIEVQDKN